MAKNSKKTKATASDGIAPTSLPNESPRAERAALSETSAQAKTTGSRAGARAKSEGKRPRASSLKTVTGEKPKKRTSRKKSVPAKATLSDNDIRLRAYFISEWRMQNGIEGDSVRDWWEAHRQLQEEGGQSA